MSRTSKYAAKVDGDIAKARADRYGKTQMAGFSQAVGGQVKIERLVKGIISRNNVMVSLNHFYMNFGKKLDKLRRTYTGPTLQLEVCIEFEKWLSRGLDSATLDEIVVAMGFENCAAIGPVCDWSWKRKLTFTGNLATTNLDDFPILIHLTVANFDFNKARDNGEDIRFMDTDICPSDGTPLKHEIDRWNKAGNEAWVWVKVPRIDASSVIDFIYLYYGNGAAADGQDPPNVWNSNFTMVQHMTDDPDNQHIADSTSWANHGTKDAPNVPVEVNADVYKGQDYDGVGDRINCQKDAELNHRGDTTFEAWVYPRSGGQGGYGRIFDKYWIVLYMYHTADPNEAEFYIVAAGGFAKADSAGDAVTYNNWHHIAGVYDGSNALIYVDGVRWVGGATSGLIDDHSAHNMYIGNHAIGDKSFDGIIDSARVSDVARSSDWIIATNRSFRELLITYGAEEAV